MKKLYLLYFLGLLIIITSIFIYIKWRYQHQPEHFFNKDMNCDKIKDPKLKNECRIRKSCFVSCDYINNSNDSDENKLQMLNKCVDSCIINKNIITGDCKQAIDDFRHDKYTHDEFCAKIGPAGLKCENLEKIQEEVNVKCLKY
jgi:hypothetical protein